MKKLFAGLVATIMMIGLVSGLTGGAAVAGPYEGTVPTKTSVGAPDVNRGDRGKVVVRVAPANGSGQPKGTVTVTVERRAGGYSFKDSAYYDGGKLVFKTGVLRKLGKYDVKAHFEGKNVWKNSNDTTVFLVTR